MAVAEVIRGGGEGVRETVKVSAETWDMVSKRAKIVMIRQLPTYDYEKVVWNSTFTVGLIAVAWGAVKLGKWIEGLSALVLQTGTTARGTEPLVSFYFYSDQPAFGLQKQFFEAVDYVEGSKKDAVLPYAEGMGGAVWNAIARYRANADEYASFKAKMYAKWLESYPPESGRPSLETQYATYLEESPDIESEVKKKEQARALSGAVILDAADRFFANWGPVLPIAAVMGHMGLEFVRVKSLQRRIKKEAELE